MIRLMVGTPTLVMEPRRCSSCAAPRSVAIHSLQIQAPAAWSHSQLRRFRPGTSWFSNIETVHQKSRVTTRCGRYDAYPVEPHASPRDHRDSPPHDVSHWAIKACLRPRPRARAFSLCPRHPEKCDSTFRIGGIAAAELAKEKLDNNEDAAFTKWPTSTQKVRME